MATSTTTTDKKNGQQKKSRTSRLTTNDKLVLKRARVLPRGKRVAPKKEITDESNATTRK